MASLNAARESRELTTESIVLGLLNAVEDNATVTQRDLAQQLGIALGLVNTYLKRCSRKGLLKVTEIPTRRYAYYVTPQGFAEKSRLTARYLSSSFSFMRRACSEVGELFEGGVGDRFVLVGPGDLADVAMLVAIRTQVTIAAILPAECDAAVLKAALDADKFDRAIVTAMENSQAVFAAAVAAYGESKVCAPKLLRIRASAAGEVANE